MKRWLLGALATVLVIAVLGAVAWFTPLFSVRNIEVEGQEHTTEAEIIEASGIREGENLLRLNYTQAATQVYELPWVKEVKATYSLPSTVHIAVEERTPLVWIARPEGIALVDESGHPFVIAEPPMGTVEVSGAAQDSLPDLEKIVEVAKSLGEQRPLVARIDAASPRDIMLELHDGRRVRWGAAEDNHDKARALKVVLSQEGQEWDISDPTLVTVR